MDVIEPVAVPESRDGAGAGDHDQPYRFGHVASTTAPCPFRSRELAHLLLLRARLEPAELRCRGKPTDVIA